MDQKQVYESLGSIAEALPDSHRAEFAELAMALVQNSSSRTVGTVIRWMRDAGHLPRPQ